MVVVYDAFPQRSWSAGFKVKQFDDKFKPMKSFTLDGGDMEGRLVTANDERVPVKIKIDKKSPTELSAKLTVDTEEPFASSRLMYEQMIRFEPGVGVRVTVNGEETDYSLPFKPKQKYQKLFPIREDGGVTTIVIDAPKATWTITGKFAVILQDLRHWKSDALQVRLMFTPYSGQITKASLEFNIAVTAKK